MDERLEKIKQSAYLLPDLGGEPGGKVVQELVYEIETLRGIVFRGFCKVRDCTKEVRRLRLAISRQKEFLDEQIDDLHGMIQNEREGRYQYKDLADQQALLLVVQHANRRISEELNLDESIQCELTEFCPDSDVPMLPILDFCTLYKCVQKSYRANYEGGKYNCIGDETRRLVKNEHGFLTCPTCHNSYGSG